MLNRQKTILEFLRVANRPVSRYELTKWSFLLRHEAPSEGGSAFYDFVPYQYGPFSFSLYQELDKLQSNSYILAHGENECVISEELGSTAPRATASVSRDVENIVRRFGNASKNKLTDYVYTRHPTFTCNSKLKRLAKRPTTVPAVYTAGYEGRSVDAFINLLIENGIRRLLDVRMNPIARRYGFHRSTLSRLCGKVDIEYVHMPTLGIRSGLRQNLTSKADYDALFSKYEATTLQTEADSIAEAASLMAEKPTVLVCMERDHSFCHRSRLANAIARLTELPIQHLGSSPDDC